MAVSERTSQLESGFAKFLKALEVLVGPAVLADIVSRVFNAPGWAQAGAAALTCGVCAVVLYKGYLKFLTKHLGGLLSILLAIALIFEVASNIHKDPMLSWERRIMPILDKCNSDSCIADTLSSDQSPVPGDLSNDLIEGRILLKNQKVAKMLKVNFGISSAFYGTGFSQPNGATNYWAARVPEYLTPNYAETINRVWTWELQPEQDYLNKKLSEIFRDVTPLAKRTIPKGAPNFLRYLNDNFTNELRLDDSKPVVVRFAQMPDHAYSGCMGRQEARRVFASHLGEILGMDMTVAEAVSYSGNLVEPARSEQATFIWVFIPSAEAEVVPANWSSIIPSLKSWLDEPKTCP